MKKRNPHEGKGERLSAESNEVGIRNERARMKEEVLRSLIANIAMEPPVHKEKVKEKVEEKKRASGKREEREDREQKERE